MNAEITLVVPSIEYEKEYLDFYYEWIESKENIVPWVVQKDPTNFKEYLHFLKDNHLGNNLPKGWVTDSTFWIKASDNKIIGAVNIRHQLTKSLRESGGHIGYGIRPSERKKGYATTALSLSLIEAKKIGIDCALVVCDESNIGSKKTILSNGGVQEDDFVCEDGNVINRFWIIT